MSKKVDLNILIGNIVLVCFFVIEIASKSFNDDQYINFASSLFKSSVIFILIVSLILKNKIQFIYPLFVLCIFFLIGHSTLMDFNLINNSRILLKYIYPIILLIYFSEIYRINTVKLYAYFSRILFINSVFIILGFLFNFSLFKTYSGERFGFSGLIFASATATYIYGFHIWHCINKIRGKKKILGLDIFILISSLLVGTKTIYLFWILGIFYLLNILRFKGKLVLQLLLIFSATLIFTIAFKSSEIFNRIYESHGILSVLLSKRDILFRDFTYPFINENWTFLNYLFGGFISFDVRSQIGVFDLILTFGFLGAFLYIFSYLRIIKKLNLDISDSIFLCVIILTAFTTGNFFMYTFTQLIFTIFVVTRSDSNKHINNDLKFT